MPVCNGNSSSQVKENIPKHKHNLWICCHDRFAMLVYHPRKSVYAKQLTNLKKKKFQNAPGGRTAVMALHLVQHTLVAPQG